MEKHIPEEPQRKKVYNKLFEIIVKEKEKGEPDEGEELNLVRFPKTNDECVKMALNIERGIFNYALKRYGERALMTGNLEDMENKWNDKFKQLYLGRAVCIVSNLNPEGYLGNKKLIRRLMGGEFNEFEMCEFDAQKMFPERYDEIVFKYGTKFDYRPIDINERSDGILQCRKCKSYKTEYNEKMTRSADEPTTKFCYCHNCGNRWKFC